MVYLFLFLWVILCCKLADSLYKKNKLAFFLAYTLGIVPLIVIAGLRDITIGIDTSAYPVTTYDFIEKGYSIGELVQTLRYIEPLYLLLSYISVQIYHDIHSILLTSSAITIIGFYTAFVKLKRYSPLWLSSFLFLFLFYNTALNAQRQFMAISIVFAGFAWLINKKKKDLLIFTNSIAIAFLIHKSAIIATILIPLFYFDNKNCKKHILYGSILFFLFYFYIFSKIPSFEIFSKYDKYQQGNDYKGFFSISEFIIRVTFLYLLYLSSGKMKKTALFNCCKYAFLSEFCINLLQIKSRFIGRLGFYIFDLYIIFIPYFVYKLGSKRIKILSIATIFITCVAYWWYVFIYGKAGFTFPYTSKILGIY